MGNQSCDCCEEKPQRIEQIQIQVADKVEIVIQEPVIAKPVQQNILHHKPFQDLLPETVKRKQFGNAFYKGKCDELGRPTDYGTMIYNNGSVFIGEFIDGKANGPGHYILPDGSYYHGTMVNNVAECSSAVFETQNFKFEGQVKENKFDGKGKQKGTNYDFQGTYSKGRRIEGVLCWTQPSMGNPQEQQNYQYTGKFNKNGKFQGHGQMVCPAGKYVGYFKDGLKHGRGEFNFSTGLRYVGDYENGIREGSGTIYKKSGGVAYNGQISNGVPNGRGYILNTKNEQIYGQWIEGIDKTILPEDFMGKETQISTGKSLTVKQN